MKILKVMGKNLASIASEFCIDFTDHRFAKSGVFAITGRTGGGKSTILDAICLALYATTPRLKANKSTKISQINELQNITTNNPASIMTYGKKDCYAKVEFLSNTGEHCVATWKFAPKRAGGKPDESVAFENLDTNQHLTSKREVKEAVIKAIGLSEDQFNQVVLLPQGSFNNFLKADPNDRAQLLEKITGSVIYNELSRYVFALTKEIEEQIERKVTMLGAFDLLDETQRQQLETEQQTLTDSYQNTLKEQAHIKKAQESKQKLSGLQKEQQQAQNALAKIAIMPAELEQQKQYVADHSRFVLKIGVLQQLQNSEQAVTEQQQKVKVATQRLTELTEQWQQAERKKQNCDKQCDQVQEEQQQAEPMRTEALQLDNLLLSQEEQYNSAKNKSLDSKQQLTTLVQTQQKLTQELQTLQSDLDTATQDVATLSYYGKMHNDWSFLQKDVQNYLTQSQRQAELAQQIATKQEQSKTLDKKIAVAEEKLVAIEKDLQKYTKEQAKAKELLAQQDTQNCASELTDLRNQQDDIKALVKVIEVMPTNITELQTEQDQLAKVQQEAQRITTELTQATQQKQLLQQEIANLDGEYQKSMMVHSLDELRRQLANGEPCPLCGAVHHPYAELMPNINACAELKEQLDTKRQELENKTAQISALERQQGQCEAQITVLTKNIQKLNTSITKIIADSNSLFLQVAMSPLSQLEATVWTETLTTLDQRSKDLKAQEKKLTSIMKAVEKAQKSLMSSADNLSECNAQKTNLTTQLNELRSSRQQCDITALNDEQQRITSELETVTNTLNTYFTADIDWGAICRTNPQTAIESIGLQIQAGFTKYENVVQQQTSLQQQITDKNTVISSNHTAVDMQTQQYNVCCEEEKSALKLLKSTQTKRKGLLGGLSVEQFTQQMTKKVADAQQAKQEADQEFIRLSQDKAVQTESCKSEQETYSHAQVKCKEASEQFKVVADNFNVSADYLVTILTLDDHTIQDYQTAIATYEQKVKDAQEKVTQSKLLVTQQEQELAQQLSMFNVADLENGFLSNTYIARVQEVAKQQKQDLDNVVHQLKTDDDYHQKVKDLAEEIERIKAKNKNLIALNGLIGSREGTKFSKFAQNITFDILLAGANSYLKELMPRYELKRVDAERDTLLVMVIDHDNCDSERPYSAISGGESFAVSLSLAIALSDITSGHSRIESLFIDEGFATLDPQSLESVLTVLENLKITGRSIGIITHLQEVSTRIQTHIALEPIADEPMHSSVVLYPQ